MLCFPCKSNVCAFVLAGTPLGDPIESSALRKAVVTTGADLPPDFVFSVGAIKALTGHMEGSAGLAGLVQAVLAGQQSAVFPLRYRSLNPYVGNSLEGWEVKSR
jgi:acyl transferase domain-containing protein